ncbi:MAG: TIGR02452 family protein [Lachnospiraceae bacterium]|nr:TIGR02452 family protein [Lachnospiraceae bacterium]
MTRENRREIAIENGRISKSGYYDLNGKRIQMKLSQNEIREVTICRPDEFEEINPDLYENYGEVAIDVVDMDSFAVAKSISQNGDKVLVMNFANARHPGGGYLNGASAQEESLCRASTLFSSLASDNAKEMYRANAEVDRDEFDTDYMLLSKKVEVFRDENHEFLEDSFLTSVVTVAAPNVNGRAAGKTKEELSAERRNKIRNLTLVAMREGYNSLVLGAWGCGAFGNDPSEVAEDFRSVLIDERYVMKFKRIVFAVYKSKSNFEAFENVIDNGTYHFARREGWCVSTRDSIPMLQMDFSKQKTGDVGYIQGYLSSGKVFFAELFNDIVTNETSLIFVVSTDGLDVLDSLGDMQVEETYEENWRNSVLVKNLTLFEFNDDGEAAKEVLDLIVFNKVVEFEKDSDNIELFTALDINGNPIVACNIVLEEPGKYRNTVPFTFIPFLDDEKIFEVKF